MLPAHKRLTTEFFNETIAGRSFHSPLVSIKVILSSKIAKQISGESRFAVSASKKNFKTAVARNAARRKVYTALSGILSSVSDGFYAVILPKPEAVALRQPELRKALQDVFYKAGIMKKTVSKVE